MLGRGLAGSVQTGLRARQAGAHKGRTGLPYTALARVYHWGPCDRCPSFADISMGAVSLVAHPFPARQVTAAASPETLFAAVLELKATKPLSPLDSVCCSAGQTGPKAIQAR